MQGAVSSIVRAYNRYGNRPQTSTLTAGLRFTSHAVVNSFRALSTHDLRKRWQPKPYLYQQIAGVKTKTKRRFVPKKFVAPVLDSGHVSRNLFRRCSGLDQDKLSYARRKAVIKNTQDVDDLSKPRPKVVLARRETASEALEAELKSVAHDSPHPRPIKTILTILIDEDGIKPTHAYYEALILANCHPDFGSLETMKSVLAQLEEEKFDISAGILIAVLKVLAIHPDHQLRETILNKMRQQWIQPTVAARDYIIAGLIREGQIEMAQLEIEKMQYEGIEIAKWIFVLLIHKLCELHDYRGALQLTYKLHDEGVRLPRLTWLRILESSASNGGFQLARWIWMQMVEVVLIKPDATCCRNVLSLAAEEGDTKLAESAMVVLQERDPELAQPNQDLLEAAYTKAGTKRDSNVSLRGNLVPLFSKHKGLQDAYFDPWVAISKRLQDPKLTRRRT